MISCEWWSWWRGTVIHACMHTDLILYCVNTSIVNLRNILIFGHSLASTWYVYACYICVKKKHQTCTCMISNAMYVIFCPSKWKWQRDFDLTLDNILAYSALYHSQLYVWFLLCISKPILFLSDIPKTARPESLNEVRNISCTPVLSKVMEHFVLERIRAEIQPKPNQYGGIPVCGTTHYLLQAWNNILELLDEEGSVVTLISIDFAKAFNTMAIKHVWGLSLTMGHCITQQDLCPPSCWEDTCNLKWTGYTPPQDYYVEGALRARYWAISCPWLPLSN